MMNRRGFLKTVVAAGAAIGAALLVPWKRPQAKWHHIILTFDEAVAPGVRIAIDGQWIGVAESWSVAWDTVSAGVRYVEDKRIIAEGREFTAENGEACAEFWRSTEGPGG